MHKFLILSVVLTTLLSCKKEDYRENNVRIDKQLISKLNSESYDTLIIDSNKFVLDAYLWRDFMPGSFPDSEGRIPLNSINWLTDIDSTEISDNIDLIKQHVIYNDSVWISDYENESRSVQAKYEIEKISREGPEWGPEIYVDIISKVFDSNTNKEYYIRITNIYIVRTD